MKRFYVVENTNKIGVDLLADRIYKHIIKRGMECIKSKGYIDADNLPKDLDCIITLGGDGTLIRAARDIAKKGIPIIGINMGHLGYLTCISKTDDIENVLDMLINDEYSLEKRMMLEGYSTNGKHKKELFLALNEILITRSNGVKPIRCKAYVDGEFLNESYSDGIIISTPTGSTAYNLSAGGPIIEPEARMMVITPICPHALNHRSIVVSPNREIKIEICKADGIEPCIVSDGDIVQLLDSCDEIYIKESSIITKLIKLNGATFLDNLRNKMSAI